MIEIIYEGRLGNHLFQYGRALIDHLELGHSISNLSPEIAETNIIKLFPQHEDGKEKVVQEGYFQDDDTINKFKKYKKILFNDPSPRDGLFVHVRLGDTITPFGLLHYSYAPQEYYERAIDQLNVTTGFISSDRPDHTIVQNLIKKYNLELYQDTPDNTIIFGSRFSNKVLSLGTYSWWIGFLGNDNNITTPIYHDYKEWHPNFYKDMGWHSI